MDKIETEIYYKPTDSKQYLLFTSCQPKHVATNIPYNLARRICTIVGNTETRNIRLEELKTFLKNQNYPKPLIEAGIKKPKEENRETLRQPRQKPKEKLLPFTTSYNPRNPDIFPIIKANIPLLKIDDRMKTILENHSIIKSHWQPKNLKEILTKAKFEDQSNNVSAKISKCGSPKCGICNNIIVGNKFRFKNGPLFEVKINMDCSSKKML